MTAKLVGWAERSQTHQGLANGKKPVIGMNVLTGVFEPLALKPLRRQRMKLARRPALFEQPDSTGPMVLRVTPQGFALS
jgi:hypothetical protein